jgi:hypothetical protein
MRNYSSQIITHAGYVIALTVGFLTIFSRLPDLWRFFGHNFIGEVALFFPLFIIGFSCLYFLVRIVYWATLCDQVMVVTEEELTRARATEEELKEKPIVFALEKKALDSLKDFAKRHRFTMKNLARLTKVVGHRCFGYIFALSLIFGIITALAIH